MKVTTDEPRLRSLFDASSQAGGEKGLGQLGHATDVNGEGSTVRWNDDVGDSGQT